MYLIVDPILYEATRLSPGSTSDLAGLPEWQIDRLLTRQSIERIGPQTDLDLGAMPEPNPKPKRKYTRKKRNESSQ